ncbi:hypothetical protein Riv7116_1981 [Rivularia sp. PCC 7116]|uniref:hypothetical protein n=1 Tax=Rivularia sp. PCC 7116 TaxID=373994 RepID=UPI00029EFFC1|nr:hypothetical protein [Rivularia sp. PCC 7116]AFY54519.1 hypothetical protein Riv7116_1981 [Rivularia sp. PCC 7116]
MKLKYRLLTAIIATGAVILTSPYINLNTNIFGIQPTVAQTIASSDAWRKVYQQLPEFPRENKYVSKKTRKVSENQTLARRLIRYHVYIKGRAPNTRLDWKLTLADYLGANEIMYDASYPGSKTLTKNPIDGDRAAIKALNRSERNTLIQTLVNIFNQK